MCNCNVCKGIRINEEYLSKINDEEMKNYFTNVLNNYYEMQEEMSYLEAIINGSWEGADTIIQKRRTEYKLKFPELFI